MNHIAQLTGDLEVANARAASAVAALNAIYEYVTSPKFAEPGDLQGYVNVTDVALRCKNAIWQQYIDGDDARLNAFGPRVADGSHRNCEHSGETYINGWHCPKCGESDGFDRPALMATVDEQMRQHWITKHKVTPGSVES